MSSSISQEAVNRVEALAREVDRLRWVPYRAHEALLAGVTSLISSPGPSSALHLSAFFGESGSSFYGEARGTFYDAVHQNRSDLVALLEVVYRRHLQRRDSIIERSIHAKTQTKSWGVASLFELVSQKDWEAHENRHLRQMAQHAGVRDILYLWIRCSADDLWAVCLRRGQEFLPHEKRILYHVGATLATRQPAGYVARLGVLTHREQEALAHLASPKLMKQCAHDMKVSRVRFNQIQRSLEKRLRFVSESERTDERRALLIQYLTDNTIEAVRSWRLGYDEIDGYYPPEDGSSAPGLQGE